MTTKVVNVGSIKTGSYIMIDGVACRAVSAETSKSGKHGHAKMRIVAIGVLDNKKREIVLPGHDNVDVPIIEKRIAQVLSVSGDVANVMDDETYETFDLKIPDDLKETVVANCRVMFWTILGEKVMKQVKSGAE